ncbi:hypothetical protein [Terrisporobacter sp.]|uniref:hypothetical protein n=1 Tax=Terrisporobacter sp. TaxID=1965305 RepID=UPI00261C7969|nr:hypothetical protein [Terrisporobacter sp.]
MKKRIYLTFILVISIFSLGCSNFSNMTEKDAIYEVFKNYDNDKKTGLVKLSEENNYINLYYITYSESYNKIVDMSKKENLTKEDENTLEKLGVSSMEEISKEILDKVEKLYKNENIENITINIGVIDPIKIGGISPGEDITKEPISYIQFFEFTREKFESIDWKNLNRKEFYKKL